MVFHLLLLVRRRGLPRLCLLSLSLVATPLRLIRAVHCGPLLPLLEVLLSPLLLPLQPLLRHLRLLGRQIRGRLDYRCVEHERPRGVPSCFGLTGRELADEAHRRRLRGSGCHVHDARRPLSVSLADQIRILASHSFIFSCRSHAARCPTAKSPPSPSPSPSSFPNSSSIIRFAITFLHFSFLHFSSLNLSFGIHESVKRKLLRWRKWLSGRPFAVTQKQPRKPAAEVGRFGGCHSGEL